MENLTWKYVKPLERTSSVEDFEKKYNVSFPDDLRQCIKSNNGGRPSLNTFDTDKSKDRVFKTLLSFNETDVENIYKFFPVISSQSDGLIPFASDPGGNYLCLKNTDVVLYLHETGDFEYVSDSFSALLEKLHE
jgi:hypothetical protein